MATISTVGLADYMRRAIFKPGETVWIALLTHCSQHLPEELTGATGYQRQPQVFRLGDDGPLVMTMDLNWGPARADWGVIDGLAVAHTPDGPLLYVLPFALPEEPAES